MFTEQGRRMTALNFFSENINSILDELNIYCQGVEKHIEEMSLKIENNEIKGENDNDIENIAMTYFFSGTNTLRSSLIISIIIAVENRLQNFCNYIREFDNLEISFNDFNGNFFDKFKEFAKKVDGLNIDFSSKIWADIIGLYEVRNCLIHHSGELTKFKKQDIVKDFIKRNNGFSTIYDEDYDDEGNQIFEGVSQRIEIEKQGTEQAIKITKDLFSHIINNARIKYADSN